MKKGFTLIELLAIIAIIALVILVAAPLTINLIEKSRIKTMKITTEKTIQSVEVFRVNYEMENGYELVDTEIKIINKKIEGDLFELSGNLPEKGTIYIDQNGKIAVALYKDGFCGKKTALSNEISVTSSSINECVLD